MPPVPRPLRNHLPETGGLLPALLIWASIAGALAPAAQGQPPSRGARPPGQPPPVLETVGEIVFAPLLAEGFAALSLQQKVLAYELSQSALAGDTISYDQRGRHFVLIKQVLEALVSHLPTAMPPRERRLFIDYLKQFYVHHGYHDHRSAQKFLPGFTKDQLERACVAARAAGSRFPGVTTLQGLRQLLDGIEGPLFDPDYEPRSVVKHPDDKDGGKDILSASSTNFYPGLSLKEVERAFARPGGERYPLNSTVVKSGGGVREEVWRLGTADGRIPPGRYADPLRGVVSHLEAALPYAGPEQREVLRQLGTYYRTGEPEAFRRYNILWVKDHSPVDTISGFIEAYLDPRAAKGEFEALVYFHDEQTGQTMRLLADNAQLYEDHSPYAPAYRRSGVKPPVADVVTVVTAAGGAGPLIPLGINLPNEQALRQTHGSKSVLLGNVIAAASRAVAEKMASEFACEPGDLPLAQRYAAEATRLMTAMHEVIGHGSGKVSPRLEGDPRRYLKEYYSTIEEGRADLMALWSVLDPATTTVHVSSGPAAGQEVYRAYLRNVLASLRRVLHGDSFEEDHDRNRQMVVQYLIRKTGAVKIKERGGKHAYCLESYEAMRQGVGQLLAELMRIKAEGDYAAARQLVETYGRTFDPALRDEVVARARAARLPAHIAMVSPNLVACRDESGKITDVVVEYPRDYLTQQLEIAKANSP